MYDEGFSAKQIATRFGCSASVIYKICYQRGLKFRNRYSNINDEELRAVISELHKQHPNSGNEVIVNNLVNSLMVGIYQKNVFAYLDFTSTYSILRVNCLWGHQHYKRNIKNVKYYSLTHFTVS